MVERILNNLLFTVGILSFINCFSISDARSDWQIDDLSYHRSLCSLPIFILWHRIYCSVRQLLSSRSVAADSFLSVALNLYLCDPTTFPFFATLFSILSASSLPASSNNLLSVIISATTFADQQDG